MSLLTDLNIDEINIEPADSIEGSLYAMHFLSEHRKVKASDLNPNGTFVAFISNGKIQQTRYYSKYENAIREVKRQLKIADFVILDDTSEILECDDEPDVPVISGRRAMETLGFRAISFTDS